MGTEVVPQYSLMIKTRSQTFRETFPLKWMGVQCRGDCEANNCTLASTMSFVEREPLEDICRYGNQNYGQFFWGGIVSAAALVKDYFR